MAEAFFYRKGYCLGIFHALSVKVGDITQYDSIYFISSLNYSENDLTGSKDKIR